MSRDPVLWIAGPLSFQTTSTLVAGAGASTVVAITACRWEFVGCSEAGQLKRWALLFELGERRFSANALAVQKWEQVHAARLIALFQPVAVLRCDLPRGAILKALKAMLTNGEIAEVMALSIKGGIGHG